LLRLQTIRLTARDIAIGGWLGSDAESFVDFWLAQTFILQKGDSFGQWRIADRRVAQKGDGAVD
jgi:hypothetical protein